MKGFTSVNAGEVTTMRCGGTIARLYEPDTREQLAELVSLLDSFIVLGGGSNTIFGDGTVETPVIRLGKGFGNIEHQEGILTVGASVSTSALLGYCLRNALSGLEFLSGIPGTIGGALWMNAGTTDRGIMDTVLVVEYLDKDGLQTVARKEVPYRYRCGGFPEGIIITGARLDVHQSSPEEVREKVEAFMEKRRAQPKGHSAGSVFKNPPGSPAGYLIEQAGLKGLRYGGAKISEIHANFIINDGHATAADIKALISLAKGKVRELFGVELKEEVRIVD
ncbi:MAG TPA: UDP-N-acetylmuramate dehydrogenase [Deltaproteobacteria bacterium]|jgi:UDP-N-acetylmuramate dehydrogenase|nr:UDP-N-acetylmuramate dehydrogenase [Deltaproteobacteria bacterium]HOI07192.1 UDP-N-acetylmuramate dehydrogenase [Deltaproteobacteria bacterium]